MRKEQIVKENLDLLNEFMKYAFSNPEILDKIPSDAELVILPTNVPELLHHNSLLVRKLKKHGKKVITVKMQRPEPIKPELVKM